MIARSPHRACDNELRVSIFARLDVGRAAQHVELGFNDQLDSDRKLLGMSKALGWIAAGVETKNRRVLKDELECLLGFTFGWLMHGGVQMPFDKISDERDRQDRSFVEGKFSFNCASRVADGVRKLRVLMEEVGEVAQAVNDIEECSVAPNPCRKHLPKLRRHLISELVQVAAVCMAWLESMEVKV